MATSAASTSTGPSYTGITAYTFYFLQTPTDPKAHVAFNNIYGGVSMSDPGRLFTDDTTRDTLKPEREVIQEIRLQLLQEVLPFTMNNDPAIVSPLLAPAALYVMVGQKQVRLTNTNLLRALERSRNAIRDEIEFRVGLHHLYFDADPSQNYTDWTKMHLQAQTTAARPAPPTAAEIAAAVAQSMPVPMSATDLANALAPLIQSTTTAAATAGTTPTTTAATSTPSASTAQLLTQFNPASLPPDVRVRYENKQRGGNVLGSTVATPYANPGGGQNLYHWRIPDHLILADGTLFIMNRYLEEKAFLKCVCYCTNDSHAGIRAWYNTFTQVCHDYGYYAHPLWCYRKDHGQEWGFTAGGDPDDDLPQNMEIPLQRMKGTIHRVLARKEMFPSGNNRIKTIIQACVGDGYKTIKQILFHSHPVFYDQPSTLVKNYPRQVTRSKSFTLIEYFQLFVDFQQLRAFIMNIDRTLDDPNEIDIFINNAKHWEFLNRVTRDERRMSSKQYKYTKAQIVETLNKFLMEADSPALKEMVQGNRPRTFTQTPAGTALRRLQQQRPRVNLIEADEADPEEVLDSGGDEGEAIRAELNSIQVPNDEDSRVAFSEYCAIVQAIQADKKRAYTKPCVVCGGQHTFEGCKLLKDVDFLRAHFIRFCINLKKEENARAQAIQGHGIQRYVTKQKATPVLFVSDNETLDRNDHTEEDLSDDDSDFQTGRG